MAKTFPCNATYRQCLTLLKTSVIACSTALHDQKTIFSLKESWCKLVLWDEAFKEQELDEILNQSPLVAETAEKYLSSIVEVLTRDVNPVLSQSPASSDPAALPGQKEIGILHSDNPRKPVGDSDGTLESVWRSYEDRQTCLHEVEQSLRDRLSTAIEDIRFHVSCLLILQPAMQSLLWHSQHIKQMAVSSECILESVTSGQNNVTCATETAEDDEITDICPLNTDPVAISAEEDTTPEPATQPRRNTERPISKPCRLIPSRVRTFSNHDSVQLDRSALLTVGAEWNFTGLGVSQISPQQGSFSFSAPLAESSCLTP